MPSKFLLPLFACAVLALPALAAELRAQNIAWSIPDDGGTPRDPARIEQLAPAEFRIRASFEDGETSVLRHAVSRVDLVCRNAGDEPTTVIVHLDLSQDGQRTEREGRPEAGMSTRNFAFIQAPGQLWRQVDGTTDGWVATIRFDAPPGETKFGLSPWYAHGDLVPAMHALPEHDHLVTNVRRSDGGREHWELIITDPEAPSESKRTIFWHAREHAYETFSSFAMEGLIEYLLSDAATDHRRRNVFVLHPMTNVDGVAEGFEYRGGYDWPDPRRTTVGRYTLEAIDRLRPDVAVAWHNWVAPRDRNVVFYTDGEGDGEQLVPTPRAWLRFTQLFPSLRAFEHRWKDETTPLRYNWQGRQPLNEANVHQYAMKKYGTRVWGWEMPWWNCTTDDARRLGRAFAVALLTTLDEIDGGEVPAAVERESVETPQWDMVELATDGATRVENPYRDAALVGEFTAPSGAVKIVDGFFDGADRWRLRFAPDEPGDWTYQLRGEGVEILERGTIHCTAPRGHGFLHKHPDNPYAFAYADGTPFFPMGDTCYGLFDDSPITPELRAEYLATRRAQHFNFVRMTVGHSEARAAADPAYWAWGGTPQNPDLDRYNPEFFRRFDELVEQMRACGMNAELIVLNFYRQPFTDVARWTPAREREWLRYLTARYGAFDNIFLWTLANEYETHPDGVYRLDRPGDVDWARVTSAFLKANDPHGHLVTVHPVVSASAHGASPRDAADPPWRIGEFFGDAAGIDVLSQQTGHHGAGAVWDDALNCWTGDSTTVVASLLADRRYGKPVLNSENGYEFLRGAPTERRQVHATDKVRRTSWRIACAGGYFAAGFHGSIGHSDVWNRIDPSNAYTFSIVGEGAADQLKLLYEFFGEMPYWRMEPIDVGDSVVAMAEAGRVYVAYLPHGGEVELDLGPLDGAATVRWFNPRTGGFDEAAPVEGGGVARFATPDENDWALLIEADDRGD